MLPAPSDSRPSLADVVPSCLASLAGRDNRLGLPAARSAIVLLVDGLGAAALRARIGHARRLAGAFTKRATIHSVFPTTTAAALASLTTGERPGRHGLVGYAVPGPESGLLLSQLSDWGGELDPARWQRRPTLFERSEEVRCVAIGAERYRDSGFTRAVLRGADYVAARTLPERAQAALEAVREAGPALVYLYVPELDTAAHAHGWQSAEWTGRLEALDEMVGQLAEALPRDVGVLVTADHGVVDVPPESQILVDEHPELLADVRLIAGEPRCLQLHLEPEASAEAVAARWRASEGERAWVLTRAEAVEAGWFGAVDDDVLPRIGEVLVAARSNVVYYDRRSAEPRALRMIGQHGSWSPEELVVPLLRYGAYAS